MPPRLNKRQQREQEELAALQDNFDVDLNNDGLNEEENEDRNHGGFAALLVKNDVETVQSITGKDEEPEEEKGSKKKPKRKKKPAASTPTVNDVTLEPQKGSDTPPASVESKEQKRAAKKQRQREQAKEKVIRKGDEIEQALAELSKKYPDLKPTPSSSASAASSGPQLAPLLTVSPHSLSPEAELRRFFGAKVVGTAAIASSKHKPTSHRGILLNSAAPSKSKNKSSLTTQKENWANARYREGLEAKEIDESDIPFYAFEGRPPEEKWFTLVANTKYKSWTRSFVDTVHRGDPNPFYTILQHFPYHADTLMQMAEISAHREEHSTVSSLLERALFTYERALQVGGANVLNGYARLDFDAAENRGLWLCIGRYILDLLRRGCPSTAHNFTVVMLSLDPYIDPYGSLFMLDYTSIKCGTSSAEWFEKIYQFSSASGPLKESGPEHKGVDVSMWRWECLPGWVYARALAQRVLEGESETADHSKSTSYLLDAFTTYPELITLILNKSEITSKVNVTGNKNTAILTEYSDAPDNAVALLHLLAHLYAARSAPLWKLPHNVAFFKQALDEWDPLSKPSTIMQGKRDTLMTLLSSAHSPLSYSIYRHVYLSSQSSPAGQVQNYKRLFKYFPKDVQAVVGRVLSFDPFPPATASSRYEGAYWGNVESGLVTAGLAAAGGDGQNARGVLEQIRGFLANNPEMAARFPGGAEDIARLMIDDPGALFDGMLAEGGEERQAGGGMPGGFDGGAGGADDNAVPAHAPVDEEEDVPEAADTDDGEESAEEDEQAPQPTFFQSMFGRFFNFGGGAQQEPNAE